MKIILMLFYLLSQGWHNYANRLSRQLPLHPFELDDEDFFDLGEDEELEGGGIEEVIVPD